MKAKYYKLFQVLSSALLFLAVLNIKPACCDYIYQPKVPKCLTNK